MTPTLKICNSFGTISTDIGQNWHWVEFLLALFPSQIHFPVKLSAC